ncbi:MAG: NAD(P)H-dependent flavin oxidoreductase [Bryobacteraceae bacterium]
MPKQTYSSPLDRVESFTQRLGMRLPILLAPMAGACPPSLSIAVADAGGLGACGALLMTPDEIAGWANEVRAKSNGGFQMNLWIPDPPPDRDAEGEARQREFLRAWGPPVPPEAGDPKLPVFDDQCQALLAAKPKAVSSIMGLYATGFVSELKANEILWFATVTTAAEARAAEEAGADVIVAQGAEAGGHRGAFDAKVAEREAVGLMALLPQVVDSVTIPVIATGGLAESRAVAAALTLGASAVQIGTGLLRTPEAKLHPAYADQIAKAEAHETMITRAFTGRPGRSISNAYGRASADGPPPAPYPVQRGLTARMRQEAQQEGDVERMQMWAGQAARFARAEPAGTVVQQLWDGALTVLKSPR